MSARVYDHQPSMISIERMKLPQRQASKVRVPLKIREASIELSGTPMLQ